MKRVISVLMVLCMMAGLCCAGSAEAFAAGTNDVLAVIAEYNQTHGGQGELFAKVTGESEVTITGSAADVTSALNIVCTGINIIYNASIEANAENPPEILVWINNAGQFEMVGGVLRTPALALVTNSIDRTIVISGGAIYGSIRGSDITLRGGLVEIIADYYDIISDSVVVADLCAEQLTILQGATLRIQAKNAPYNNSSVFAHIAYIHPDAVLDLDAPLAVTLWANADFTEFTAYDGQLSSDFLLKEGQTLTITESCTLYLTYGNLFLNGGTLVIHGYLEHWIFDETSEGAIPGELIIRYGTVSGKNAGELAGTYDYVIPPFREWWEDVPCWVQFILRYLFFGFLWMD